jgi:hypothetical protein
MREAEFQQAIGDWRVPPPHPRVAVYRNNVAAALTSALAVRYPVTQQLVGEAFFHHMALDFAATNRPASPVLIGYGEGFADFIRDHPGGRDVPYLADVAALESLWWQAYHAPEAEPLPGSALAGIPAEELAARRLALHPSVGLISSPFAIGAIWEAHHGGAAMAEIAIRSRQSVLVARPRAEIVLRVVPPESYAFLSALNSGTTLADAAESAFADHPQFDLGAQLTGAFRLGLITGILP